MLIRFVVKNLFSFKEQTEFNLLPGKVKRLASHKYTLQNGIEVLKLSAIYGANGSGKSNLVKGITLLKETIKSGKIPPALANAAFKLSPENKELPTEIGIEFYTGNDVFYYEVALHKSLFQTEHLSVLGEEGEAEILFNRNATGEIQFGFTFEADPEYPTLKRIIEGDLLKPHKSLLNLLSTITNKHFEAIKEAHSWLEANLVIVTPETKPGMLVEEFVTSTSFALFAKELLKSFSTGIEDLNLIESPLEDVLGSENQEQIDNVTNVININPEDHLVRLNIIGSKEEIIAFDKNGEIMTRRLALEHLNEEGELVEFGMNDESDGTQRLLDYLPAIADVINDTKVYVIDEIERSIHPSLIKELIRKFSEDDQTKGQLIFTTHESNLLDQDILRTDEIWLTEKNAQGASTMYPLSNYKEHATIDIRKGYLAGRYGAIPFLGDLKHLNWHAPANEAE